MALNQVIHGSNRVVENPNRYKLNPVAGQANTYDLEKQPGVITDNGTPYNKRILDQIDNVLSYLTPSVEKVGTITPFPVLSNIFMSSANTDAQDLNTSYTSTLVGSVELNNTHIEYNLFKVLSSSSWDSAFINSWFNNKGTSLGTVALRNGNYIKIDLGEVVDVTIHMQTFRQNGVLCYGINDYRETTISNLGLVEQSITARYIELYGTNSSSNIEPYYFYLTRNEIEYKTTYQNQFTLDNNTSFTNNQRVFIETPNAPQIILSNPQKLEEKTWQLNDTNTILTSNDNITITTTRGNSNLVNFIDGDISTRYTFSTPKTESTNVIIDLLTDKAISSLQLYINNVTGYANKLYYSSNGTTWKEYFEYSSQETGTNWTETINNTLIARYIKIESTNNSTSVTNTSFYEIKCTINDYTIIGGMTIDGVLSNTLNGIDIPTLLQPSTKYELIYKEDTNKFELGGAKVLFDITLDQSVNQVDLTGISNMLEIYKIYCLIVVGENDNASGQVGVSFGSSSLGAFDKSYPTFILFTPFIYNSKLFIETINGSGVNSNVISNTSNITDYENVRLSSGYNFKAGTQIIIKEVA